MCQHQPRCPQWPAPDHLAARIVADQPGQGWSLLCNGVIEFDDDGGELLPDGRAVPPDPPWSVPPCGHRRLSVSDEPDAMGESRAGPAEPSPRPHAPQAAAAGIRRRARIRRTGPLHLTGAASPARHAPLPRPGLVLGAQYSSAITAPRARNSRSVLTTPVCVTGCPRRERVVPGRC
jgi:uncharacterized protein DUF5999